MIRKRRIEADVEVPHAWVAHYHAAFNYYHWLIDILPLLLMPAYREMIQQHAPTLILPRLHMPFHEAALNLVGLSDCRSVHAGEFDVLKAEVMYVPVLPRATDQAHPMMLKALRSHFLPKIRQGLPRKRIYLTRAGGKRSVTNEKELQQVLEKHHISTVRLETLPFIEQVELFANTELVVAPHGAGLANIVFLPEASSVVEMFPRTYVNPCYWRIASALGCSYGVLPGAPRHSFTPSSDCYRVNPQELDDLIRRTLLRGSRSQPRS